MSQIFSLLPLTIVMICIIHEHVASLIPPNDVIYVCSWRISQLSDLTSCLKVILPQHSQRICHSVKAPRRNNQILNASSLCLRNHHSTVCAKSSLQTWMSKDVEPIAVMVAPRIHSEVQHIPGPDVHAPLNLLPIRLRIGVGVVGALQQRLRTPRPVRLQAHGEVHAVAADGPHLRGMPVTMHTRRAAPQAEALAALPWLRSATVGQHGTAAVS